MASTPSRQLSRHISSHRLHYIALLQGLLGPPRNACSRFPQPAGAKPGIIGNVTAADIHPAPSHMSHLSIDMPHHHVP